MNEEAVPLQVAESRLRMGRRFSVRKEGWRKATSEKVFSLWRGYTATDEVTQLRVPFACTHDNLLRQHLPLTFWIRQRHCGFVHWAYFSYWMIFNVVYRIRGNHSESGTKNFTARSVQGKRVHNISRVYESLFFAYRTVSIILNVAYFEPGLP